MFYNAIVRLPFIAHDIIALEELYKNSRFSRVWNVIRGFIFGVIILWITLLCIAYCASFRETIPLLPIFILLGSHIFFSYKKKQWEL